MNTHREAPIPDATTFQMPNTLITNLPILFEDPHLFILSKPSLLHSVISAKSTNPSVAEQLLETNPWLNPVSEKEGDAGLVQRLDFETSGILLGAKTREVWQQLRGMLKAGEIQKNYRAIVEGKIEHTIELSNYIGSPNRGASKVRVYTEKPRKSERALPAHTKITPVRYLSDLEATLIEASAPTARRHQIRAHVAFSGHPLLGDMKYGATRRWPETPAGVCPAFILHAFTIRLLHPVTGALVEVKAELPAYLKHYLTNTE